LGLPKSDTHADAAPDEADDGGDEDDDEDDGDDDSDDDEMMTTPTTTVTTTTTRFMIAVAVASDICVVYTFCEPLNNLSDSPWVVHWGHAQLRPRLRQACLRTLHN